MRLRSRASISSGGVRRNHCKTQMARIEYLIQFLVAQAVPLSVQDRQD
jgi:hypothetical protein